MIGKTLGNLKIVSEIGKGGMGVVYLAEHKTLANKFAVKSLTPALTTDPNFSQRFYQEAQNLSLLDHTNIVQAIDFFDEDNQFFFVMEYVDGRVLNELIEEKHIIPVKQALSIFEGILSGLDFAHSKGVIHRDIKPSNIIVDKSGRARITDFGIAILAGDKRLTDTGTNIGSPWYMSPEQILHPANIDHRSDVYSVGILLYEMLTGDVPFDAETDYSVKEQQVNSQVPNPTNKNPEIDPQLQQIILKALEKGPDKRFSSCGDFLKAINAYEKGTRPRPNDDSFGARKLMISAIGVAVLVLLVFVVLNFRNPRSTLPPTAPSESNYETAGYLINAAVDRLSIICRDINLIEFKQDSLNSGKNRKYTEEGAKHIKTLKNQITQYKNNITEGIPQYRKLIESLIDLKGDIVDEELNNYKQMLDRERNVQRMKKLLLVENQYKQVKNGSVNTDFNHMRENCTTR